MAAEARTRRGGRRRRLGQNFLGRALAEELVDAAGFAPGELVLEIGAGLGALTFALARRGLDVLAFEVDPQRVRQLRARLGGFARVRVIGADFVAARLPDLPFRAIGSLPFGRTTDILRRLLEDPTVPLLRADVIVQWEVARKRAAVPPTTLLSTAWAPWWELRLGRRIPATAFTPVPRVDAAVLTITPRTAPLLPPVMAARYAGFVRAHWPFGQRS